MTAQTQTAHILALRFGLTPQKWKQKTIQRLLELLEQQNGHLVTGFFGYTVFLRGAQPEWLLAAGV